MVFDFTFLPSRGEIDVVTDFAAGVDKLILSGTAFTGLNWVGGSLDASQFASGAGMKEAQGADVRLFYDTKTGNLYFDADGNGTGDGAHLVATLGTTAHPALTAGDFGLS